MNDREMLVLAARAASYEVVVPGTGGVFVMNGREWNPLASDKDALRLAVALEIDVTTDIGSDNRKYQTASFERNGSYYDRYEDRGNDPYAATRRAIVRAAAAIGEKT